jgi:hypothetical protein
MSPRLVVQYPRKIRIEQVRVSACYLRRAGKGLRCGMLGRLTLCRTGASTRLSLATLVPPRSVADHAQHVLRLLQASERWRGGRE